MSGDGEHERARSAADGAPVQLRALIDATLEASTADSLEEALQILTHHARAIVGAHQATMSTSIGLSDARELNGVSLSDKYAAWREFDAPPDGTGIYSIVARTNVPMRMTQVELEAHAAWRGFGDAADRHPPMRGWLAAPLVGSGGENVGVIQLSDKYEGEFDEHDEAILVQIAQIASIIVERKRVERERAAAVEQLRAERARSDEVFRQMPAGLVVAEAPSGRVVYGNAQVDRILRRDPARFESLEDYERLSGSHPDGRPYEPEEWPLARALAAGEVVHDEVIEIERGDGTVATVAVSAGPIRSPDGRIEAAVATFADISEQRDANRELGAAHRRLMTVLERLTDGFFALDREWRFTYINSRSEELMQREREELLGRSIWDEFPAASDLGYGERYRRAMDEQTPVSFEEYFPPLDLWTEVHAYPSSDGLTVFFQDVGARRRAEAALRESESRLKLALETARMGMWEWDLASGTLSWPSELERIYGLEPGAFGGTREAWIALVHPDDRDAVTAAADRAVAGAADYAVEYRTIRPDAIVVWVESIARVELDAEGRAVRMLGTTSDITDRKSLEAQLRQSQKMEAVGSLAGGVAHDFNNLLTVISGYSDLALRTLHERDPLREQIETIRKAAESATALTRQLLAFSRRQILELKVLDLNSTVASMDRMLRRLIGEDVILDAHLDPALWRVRFDPGQMEQALVNLAVNARDAMPGGGRLTVETRNVELDKEYADRHLGVVPGLYVVLSVSDTGMGMDEATLGRVFEPFFTTKPVGKGTGLGLSTVYGIVAQCGGRVEVRSEVGKGSAFEISLPAVLDEGVTPEERRVVAAEPRGAETVLVVEDDERVRRLASRSLREFGFNVVEASNGGEALLTCENHAGPIDVMVTDVVMPQMSGKQLAVRLAALRPDMRVLYVSGYTDDAIVHHGILEEGIDFLPKPYTPDQLAARVREILDRPR